MSGITKPRFNKWFYVPALGGLFAFLVYLFSYLQTMDIASIFVKTDIFFFSLAVACIFFTVVFNALAWKYILRGLGVNAGFNRVLNLSWIRVFLDSVVPGAWFGDAYKAYLLSREPQISGGKAVASIVVKKLFEDSITLVTLALGITLLGFSYNVAQGIFPLLGIFILLLATPMVIMIFFSARPQAVKKVLRALKRLQIFLTRKSSSSLYSFDSKLEKAIGNYTDGFRLIRSNPRMLIVPSILLSLGGILTVLSAFLVFVSIGRVISADKVIITNSVVMSLQANGMLLSSVAQVVSSNVYSALGISSLVSVSSSLLAGFASFWFKTATSFCLFQGLILTKRLEFSSPPLNSKEETYFEPVDSH
jgi:uncharacterized protein (TIRG00374 family)